MFHLIHITTVPQTFNFLLGQMRAMQRRGLRVAAVTSPGPEIEKAPGLGAFPTKFIPMQRAISPIRDMVAVYHLIRHLRLAKPLIVHAHTPKAGLLGMLAATLVGVPVRIYHIHGLRFQTLRGWRRWLTVAGDRLACRLATQVLCVGESVRRAAIEAGVVDSGVAKVLGNGSIDGVDAAERFNPARLPSVMRNETRSDLGIKESDLVLGFVGRLVVDKGIVELVDAWLSLRKRFENLHLVVVGEYEPHDALPTQVQECLEGDPRVHLLGHVSDMERYYSLMNVLCLPSYREGLPYVPLEAAAMEVPVVATRVCGCIDAVVDGVTGTLVACQDAAAIADATTDYLENRELRRQHGLAGRKRVADCFPPLLLRDQTWREYIRLTSKQGLETAFESDGGDLQSEHAA